MQHVNGQDRNAARSRNIRLAMLLGLLALSFYVGFIVMTGLG
jgi:hypothetical protein